MKRFWTIANLLALAILLIVVSCTFVSCKSKKKIVEKEKTELSINSEKSISKIITNNIIEKDTSSLKSESIKITSGENLELTQADPEKVIVIEDETGKKLKITGANAVISTNKVIEENATQEDSSSLKKAHSEIVKKEDTKTATKLDQEKKNLDVKTSGLPTWVWIVGILILLLIIVIWLARKYIKAQIPLLK